MPTPSHGPCGFGGVMSTSSSSAASPAPAGNGTDGSIGLTAPGGSVVVVSPGTDVVVVDASSGTVLEVDDVEPVGTDVVVDVDVVDPPGFVVGVCAPILGATSTVNAATATARTERLRTLVAGRVSLTATSATPRPW